MEKSVENLALLFYGLDRPQAAAQPADAAAAAPASAVPQPAPPGAPQLVISATITAGTEMFRLRREIGPFLGKLRNSMAKGGAILYLTAAERGDGVSTVARELAYAAGAMPSCRVLLLDCNSGEGDQGSTFGQALPDVVASCLDRGYPEVAAIVADGSSFHAATLCPDLEPGGARAATAVSDLYDALRSAYDLILLDCPPVLEAPYFVRLAREAPEVLLVVQAEKTRIPAVMRAKGEIALAGGRLAGVVMNKRRFFIPKFLYGRL